MKIALFLFVATMALIGWPGDSVAQQLRKAEGPPKVSPELWKKAHDAGTVRVIVNLHVPGWTSKKLSREGELEREKMVVDVQAEVLRELAGTRHKVTAQFKIVPGIELEVGSDTLAVLEQSNHVINVHETRLRSLTDVDFPLSPMQSK